MDARRLGVAFHLHCNLDLPSALDRAKLIGSERSASYRYIVLPARHEALKGHGGLRLAFFFVLALVESIASFILFPSVITFMLNLVVLVAVVSGFYWYFLRGRGSHQPRVGPVVPVVGATPFLKPEGVDFRANLSLLEAEFDSGRITKLQRDSMKKEILNDWKKRVEGALQGSR